MGFLLCIIHHVQEKNNSKAAHGFAGSTVQSSPFIAGWGLEDETFAFQVRKIARYLRGGIGSEKKARECKGDGSSRGWGGGVACARGG